MLPRHARTGEDPAPCPLQPKEIMPIFRSGEFFFRSLRTLPGLLARTTKGFSFSNFFGLSGPNKESGRRSRRSSR
jgi:hypothetical protein